MNKKQCVCINYPDDLKFMIQMRTFVTKTASEVDKWAFIDGLEYKFCPFCSRLLNKKGRENESR